MSESKYEVMQISDSNLNEWLDLCAVSRQYTPFLRDDYLEAVGFYSEKYIVKKNDVLVLGICLPIRKADGGRVLSVPYAPHQGLLFVNDGGYRANHDNLEAVDYLLDYFYENGMKSVSFSNSYNLVDIRGVQWHHYHCPEKGIYSIYIRYSALLKLSNFSLDIIHKIRKNDYRLATKRYGLKVEKCLDMEGFLGLYKATFERQNIQIDNEDLGKVKRIIETAIKNNYGEMLCVYNDIGKLTNAVFLLVDAITAYYIFGVNDPEYRNMGGSTFAVVNAIEEAKNRGLQFFDFVGANSPQRGDYKLSFNSELRPYFLCSVDYTK